MQLTTKILIVWKSWRVPLVKDECIFFLLFSVFCLWLLFSVLYTVEPHNFLYFLPIFHFSLCFDSYSLFSPLFILCLFAQYSEFNKTNPKLHTFGLVWIDDSFLVIGDHTRRLYFHIQILDVLINSWPSAVFFSLVGLSFSPFSFSILLLWTLVLWTQDSYNVSSF